MRRNLRTLLLIIMALVALLPSGTTYALDPPVVGDPTKTNLYRIFNNIIFSSGSVSTVCGSSSTTSLNGSSGAERTWNYLRAKGLSAEATAGIMGNLQVESGFIPDIQERSQPWPEGGWGIAQWTGSRRTDVKNYVIAKGLPYTNEATPADQIDDLLLAELNFMWEEATDRGDLVDLKNSSTDVTDRDHPVLLTGEAAVKAATISWHNKYEISADATPTNRINQGIRLYNIYKDNPAIADATSSAACSSGSSYSADGFTYYSQYDPAWASSPYGSRTILSSGCGPTSMAMIISTLTGSRVTPDTVATWGSEYYIEGVGSSHDLFGKSAAHWGLKANLISGQEELKAALASGSLVVAAGSGAYPYTSGGHIIVIRGMKPDGTYLVGNPLPLRTDQDSPSAVVVNNTAWFETGYSWALVAPRAMYAISK